MVSQAKRHVIANRPWRNFRRLYSFGRARTPTVTNLGDGTQSVANAYTVSTLNDVLTITSEDRRGIALLLFSYHLDVLTSRSADPTPGVQLNEAARVLFADARFTTSATGFLVDVVELSVG